MKLFTAAIAAAALAVDVDVAVGPFGPIQGAENRLLARLRRDAVGSRKPAAAARVSHPTGLLVWGESLFATEFPPRPRARGVDGAGGRARRL